MKPFSLIGLNLLILLLVSNPFLIYNSHDKEDLKAKPSCISHSNILSKIESPKITIPVKTRIYFSGLWWHVTHYPNTTKSPGKNYWSAANVWVDRKGLHLKLSKDAKTGKWYCAQVISEKRFGYGTYQFFINGKVGELDKNVVFGLFNYSGVDYHDEIDIEFAKWGNDTTSNLHYTVWPAEKKVSAEWKSAQHFKFTGSTSTHRFKRTSKQVDFQTLKGYQNGDLNQVYSVTCIEKIASHKLMPVLFNLWLFNNRPPSDQQEVELIIKAFKFIPLAK